MYPFVPNGIKIWIIPKLQNYDTRKNVSWRRLQVIYIEISIASWFNNIIKSIIS